MAELDEQSHLTIVAQLGQEAQAFKSSQLGQYLNDCAAGEISDALQALTTADPIDSALITKLQNRVFRAQATITWIDESIESGVHALSTLQQNEEEF